MRPILTLLGLFLCADAATAATVGGVDLLARCNHAPVRSSRTCGAKKTVVTHYVSAVYVPRTGSIHAIANPKLAKAVQIHITNDKSCRAPCRRSGETLLRARSRRKRSTLSIR